MRHRNKKALLNRPADQRRAMVRNLLSSLFLEKKLTTTNARARALSGEANRLIALTQKKDDMNAIRELMRVLTTKEASKQALEYIRSQKDQTSGFVRTTRIRYREGDGALLVQVELI